MIRPKYSCLRPALALAGDPPYHDTICLTCSGKKREDLLDRAEVVEAVARRLVDLDRREFARRAELRGVCMELGIRWPAVEGRVKELEEER